MAVNALSVRPLLLALLAGLAVAGCETRSVTSAPVDAPSSASVTNAEGVTTIAAVQGSGAASPLLDQRVTVEGVVVGNFATGLGGVFVQSEVEDSDPATAEGVFVRRAGDAEPRLRQGDRVRVTGTVIEDGRGAAKLTTLDAAEITVLASGVALPPLLELTEAPTEASHWERYESRRLRLAATLTVSGNESLVRFGELHVAFGPRLFQPAELAPPGPQAQAIADDNARRGLLLDDNRNSEAPKSIWYLPDDWSDERPLRAGSTIAGAEGVLDQRHGRYRLQLAEKLAGIVQAPRPPAPKVAGNLRLASLNLLNLFNGDGRGGGFPTERGANSAADYDRQQRKLIAVMQALRPDAAALMEVENDDESKHGALAQFLVALNAAGPDRDWVAVRGAAPGSDAIRVALIYRRSKLQPVGAPATLAEGPFLTRSRVPVAQAFRAGKGPVFTMVAIHFKSKGSCDEAGDGDRDIGDHQSCWNATRTDSAQRLHAWLASNPTGQGSERMVLLGDFNAHAQEDSMRTFYGHGWRDAFAEAKSERPWSYVFNGLAGRLDHALLTPALAKHLRGASEWHNNADESVRFDYQHDDDTDPWRASDHDPLLIGLDLAQ